jgi:lipoprotein-releasing system permease protein
MYKLLLSGRYLRTRFIALASIISVTLGVATMIVVNSVMAGFSTQMKERIHGILADIIIESTTTDGHPDPVALMQLVQSVAGEYIEAMTPTVEIYAMMSHEFGYQNIHQPCTIVAIKPDGPDGKNLVSPMRNYLMSRQALIEDGIVVKPALRSLDEPLDWELTDEAREWRRTWLAEERLRARIQAQEAAFDRTDSRAPDASTANTATGTDPAGDAGLAHSPFDDSPSPSTNPFDAPAADPFGPVPREPISDADLDAPLPARLYVGCGLISMPYIRKETGETETMWMLRPGQDVKISTIRAGKVPEPVHFAATVVDVFKSGMSEYDSTLVFCNLEELQYWRVMMAPQDRGDWTRGAITALQIRLKDYADAPLVVERLLAHLPPGEFQVRTWEQKQGPLLQAVEIESAILNVLLFLIIAVAGFGILAIFYMIVVEKTRDIGILKALGASSTGVMSIFLSYGLALGIVGSGVGVILGLLFVHYINEVEDAISWCTGRKVFDEAIYYFHEIPTAVHPEMVVWVAFGAMAIAVLASVLPARRAARLHPVEALRYE